MQLLRLVALSVSLFATSAHATKTEFYGSVGSTYTVGGTRYPEMESLISPGNSVSGSFSYDADAQPFLTTPFYGAGGGISKTYSGGLFSITVGSVTVKSITSEIYVTTAFGGGLVVKTPMAIWR